MPLRLDARPKAVRCLDLGSCDSCERDRVLLFGQTIGQLGGCGDLRLELYPTIRRERPVGERSKLGDLLIALHVSSSAPHRHDRTNGSSLAGAGVSTPLLGVAIAKSPTSKL